MRFYKIEQTEEIRDEVRLPARETACRLYDKEKSAQQKIPRGKRKQNKRTPNKIPVPVCLGLTVGSRAVLTAPARDPK